MYHHFGSKAGLFEAIVEAQTADLVEAVASALPEDPAAPRLRVGVDAYFRFLRSRPMVWRLQRKRSELLTSLLAHERSTSRKGKKLFAELLTTAIRAYATWWHDHPRVPRQRVVDAVMDFTQSGVKRLAD